MIKIGTSGYAFNEWVGTVYPEGTKPEDFLKIYSGLFSTVELNFSHYKMPETAMIEQILIDGGDRLTFSVKAYRTLTHNIDPSMWENEAKNFIKGIEPLLNANRLEAVLFQFPDTFDYSPENRTYLDKLLKYFNDLPKAVEFRKADWINKRVIEGMTARNVALVSNDLSDLPEMPITADVVTSPLAYIRLNGRKDDDWWGSDRHRKYAYLYNDKEIKILADRIEIIANEAKKTIVYFNNHKLGNAVKNAQMLEKILSA